MFDIFQGLKRGMLVYSIITIILGTILILFPHITGIYFSIDGIVNIMKSFQLRKYDFNSWIYDLVLSVILLLLGIMMLFDPFKVAITSIIFMGICLIYDGALNLIILYRFVLLKKKIDYFNDQVKFFIR